MVSYKVLRDVKEQREKEGGLLKYMRTRIKINWDRLKFEEDADKVADYINNRIRDFLEKKPDIGIKDEINRDLDKEIDRWQKIKQKRLKTE